MRPEYQVEPENVTAGLPVAAQHHYPAMDPNAQSLATDAALRTGRDDQDR